MKIYTGQHQWNTSGYFFNISLLFHYGCFLELWEEDAGEAASNFYAVVCCKAICFSLPFQVPEEKKQKQSTV